MTSVGINGGTCGPCFAKHDCDFMKLDAEIARRRKATPPASASEKWVPRAGELCTITTHVGSESTGPLDSWDNGTDEARVSVPFERSNTGFHYGKRSSLRPAAPAQRIETPAADLSQPVMPPAPSGGDSGQPSDPYKRTDGLTDTHIAALVAAADAVPGKLAARRARHVSECRASLESDGKARRAEVSTHPPSFPEGAYHDAPECYSTTRSRGGR